MKSQGRPFSVLWVDSAMTIPVNPDRDPINYVHVESLLMLKYLIVTSSGLESGVVKKAIKQVSGLNSLGLQAELVIISSHLFPEMFSEESFIRIVPLETVRRQDIFRRIRRIASIRRNIRDLILALGREDVLYHRGLELQITYYPLAFFRIGRRCKIVSEHQSIEIRQRLLYGSYYSALIDLVVGGFITGQTDGIIGVTDEITSYWSGRLFCRNIPHITIPNGFDVPSVPVRTPPQGDTMDLHILFVGNVSRWHGLDRIIRGIAQYKGTIQIHLHIVGNGDELRNLQELSGSIVSGPKVYYHDYCRGQQLDPVFDDCDIAIGSLGLHRQGLTQASSLKVREYCARGMPFILSNHDPDIPDSFEYCLRVSPTDEPVDMKEVVAFACEMRNKTSHPEKMRAFAEENLDWDAKIRRTNAFLATI